MNLEEAIEVLENHQAWRMGDDTKPATDPKKLTEALGTAIDLLNCCCVNPLALAMGM